MLGGLAADPAWWSDRNVTTGDADNDYAAANAGQLKWFATNAFDELDENLPGGAGAAVEALVEGFTASNNYAIVNLGQLKSVAQPFYDRLIAEGVATQYPWTETADDDMDYAVANLGQMKAVFNFELSGDLDTDGDGLPDYAETGTGIFVSPWDTGTDPNNPDSDGDGIDDATEVANRTDPNNPDQPPPVVTIQSPLPGNRLLIIP